MPTSAEKDVRRAELSSPASAPRLRLRGATRSLVFAVLTIGTLAAPATGRAEPSERFSVGGMLGGLSPADDANAGWLVGAHGRVRFRRVSLALEVQHIERTWGPGRFAATQKFDTVGLVPRWHPFGRGEVDPSLGFGLHRGWESRYFLETCGSAGGTMWPVVSLHAGVDMHRRAGRAGVEIVRFTDASSFGCSRPGANDDRPERVPRLEGWLLRVHGAFDVL